MVNRKRGWQISYIPSGNAIQAFERMQVKLKEKGFFILEVGELESFVKSVGNHGPKWVSEVLCKDLNTDPELESARQFVKHFFLKRDMKIDS